MLIIIKVNTTFLYRTENRNNVFNKVLYQYLFSSIFLQTSLTINKENLFIFLKNENVCFILLRDLIQLGQNIIQLKHKKQLPEGALTVTFM